MTKYRQNSRKSICQKRFNENVILKISFVCLCCGLTSQSTIFSHVGTEPTLLGFNQYCRELMRLAQGHDTVPPWGSNSRFPTTSIAHKPWPRTCTIGEPLYLQTKTADSESRATCQFQPDACKTFLMFTISLMRFLSSNTS